AGEHPAKARRGSRWARSEEQQQRWEAVAGAATWNAAVAKEEVLKCFRWLVTLWLAARRRRCPCVCARACVYFTRPPQPGR
ncbi:hypothetical protein J6590_044735, partial [Homalodisca vitripennis]